MKTVSSNVLSASRSTSQHVARFIPSEEIQAQSVRHWLFDDVQNPLAGSGRAGRPELPAARPVAEPEVAESVVEAPAAEPQSGLSEAEVQELIQQARQEARDEGFQQGLQQGLQQGQQQGEQLGRQQASQEGEQRLADYQANQGREAAERLQQVLQSAQDSWQSQQQTLAGDLLQLACDIARQVVRQELRSNPQALLPVLREALEMLGAETKPATIRLNPDDWARLHDGLKAALPNPKIEWLADASVPIGGCKVESAGAQVDGSLERRWQRAVAALGLVSTWYDGERHAG